jgi:hypothetical protein
LQPPMSARCPANFILLYRPKTYYEWYGKVQPLPVSKYCSRIRLQFGKLWSEGNENHECLGLYTHSPVDSRPCYLSSCSQISCSACFFSSVSGSVLYVISTHSPRNK